MSEILERFEVWAFDPAPGTGLFEVRKSAKGFRKSQAYQKQIIHKKD
ncbi:MAG TPA: hypothetical protein VH110_08800 [Candidatus Acidoferrum sp.]|nr:hypothetical protein [Candidatus Acidoferrum sp.]